MTATRQVVAMEHVRRVAVCVGSMGHRPARRVFVLCILTVRMEAERLPRLMDDLTCGAKPIALDIRRGKVDEERSSHRSDQCRLDNNRACLVTYLNRMNEARLARTNC